MKINIYPYNRDLLEVIDLINLSIDEYNECTTYIDLFLGDGLIFNNLNKPFKKYILNDHKKSTINFYNLLKTQIPEFILNQCEELWDYEISDLTQMLLNEKNQYKKYIIQYVLENKVTDKDTILKYFPRKELESVIFKLKKNDILFKLERVSNIYNTTRLNDLLFINLDNVGEEYHRKIINWAKYSSVAVNCIYSSIGNKYLNLCKNCDVVENINATGYLFIMDNKLPEKYW